MLLDDAKELAVYCGKCCKKVTGTQIVCNHCGNQLCTDLGPDATDRHKSQSPDEIIDIKEVREVREVKPSAPQIDRSDKPKPKRQRATSRPPELKIKGVYTLRTTDKIRMILKREPVKLGPKDYAVLLIPFFLIAVQFYLISALGPIILERFSLDEAAYKLFNMDKAFFGQSDLEAQLVGLWEMDFKESPDSSSFDTGIIKSQIIFTEDHVIRIAVENKESGTAIIHELEGPYILNNMILTADLVSPDDSFESVRITCLIEMNGDLLDVIWVSGFAFNREQGQVETKYRRIDTGGSLFSMPESMPEKVHLFVPVTRTR
jgi:hypothetical protein